MHAGQLIEMGCYLLAIAQKEQIMHSSLRDLARPADLPSVLRSEHGEIRRTRAAMS